MGSGTQGLFTLESEPGYAFHKFHMLDKQHEGALRSRSWCSGIGVSVSLHDEPA